MSNHSEEEPDEHINTRRTSGIPGAVPDRDSSDKNQISLGGVNGNPSKEAPKRVSTNSDTPNFNGGNKHPEFNEATSPIPSIPTYVKDPLLAPSDRRSGSLNATERSSERKSTMQNFAGLTSLFRLATSSGRSSGSGEKTDSERDRKSNFDRKSSKNFGAIRSYMSSTRVATILWANVDFEAMNEEFESPKIKNPLLGSIEFQDAGPCTQLLLIKKLETEFELKGYWATLSDPSNPLPDGFFPELLNDMMAFGRFVLIMYLLGIVTALIPYQGNPEGTPTTRFITVFYRHFVAYMPFAIVAGSHVDLERIVPNLVKRLILQYGVIMDLHCVELEKRPNKAENHVRTQFVMNYLAPAGHFYIVQYRTSRHSKPVYPENPAEINEMWALRKIFDWSLLFKHTRAISRYAFVMLVLMFSIVGGVAILQIDLQVLAISDSNVVITFRGFYWSFAKNILAMALVWSIEEADAPPVMRLQCRITQGTMWALLLPIAIGQSRDVFAYATFAVSHFFSHLYVLFLNTPIYTKNPWVKWLRESNRSYMSNPPHGVKIWSFRIFRISVLSKVNTWCALLPCLCYFPAKYLKDSEDFYEVQPQPGVDSITEFWDPEVQRMRLRAVVVGKTPGPENGETSQEFILDKCRRQDVMYDLFYPSGEKTQLFLFLFFLQELIHDLFIRHVVKTVFGESHGQFGRYLGHWRHKNTWSGTAFFFVNVIGFVGLILDIGSSSQIERGGQWDHLEKCYVESKYLPCGAECI